MWNRLSIEYGEVLSYWMQRDANIGVPRDRLMMQVEEVFDTIVPVFLSLSRELSIYATEDQLLTDLLLFDAVDGSITVRIANE
ncbi:hypothetical protein D9M68_20090 [compost metagenome]